MTAPVRVDQHALLTLGLPIARRAAYRAWRRAGEEHDVDELLSRSMLVLTKAVRCYDPQRASFVPFLLRRLDWALLREQHRMRRALALTGARVEQHAPALGDALAGGTHDVPAEPIEGDAAAGFATDPEQIAARRRQRQLVHGVLAELPDQARHLVVRHYFGGERFDHVARELGISKCSACRIHRAAQRTLAKKLRWYEPGIAAPG